MTILKLTGFSAVRRANLYGIAVILRTSAATKRSAIIIIHAQLLDIAIEIRIRLRRTQDQTLFCECVRSRRCMGNCR